MIGKGGNSQVYSGFLPDCEQVAVKVSKLSEKSSKDFLLEVDIITRIHHEGVMPLIGVCVEDSNLIAVYSYFPEEVWKKTSMAIFKFYSIRLTVELMIQIHNWF